MIPNFAIVDDGAPGVYRGGQPVTQADWESLKSLGVKRIIKLNTESEGDDSASGIGDILECPITVMQQFFTGPDLNSVETAVAFIEPGTFVHCGSVKRSLEAEQTGNQKGKGGNDRTGWVIAAYRVSRQGWTKQKAHAEMIDHGFHVVEFGMDGAWAELPEPKQTLCGTG